MIGAQNAVAKLVTRDLHSRGMGRSVNLDDQSCFEAREVDDILLQRNLTTKPKSFDLVPPKTRPQHTLSARRVAPQ
jgi:hypothetical protein